MLDYIEVILLWTKNSDKITSVIGNRGKLCGVTVLHIGIYNKPKYFENLCMFVLYFNIPGALEVEDKAFSPEYSGLLLVGFVFFFLFSVVSWDQDL